MANIPQLGAPGGDDDSQEIEDSLDMPLPDAQRWRVERAIGFLSAPDRERIIERLGYTDAEIAAYFKARGEASLPCLQPRGDR